MREKKVFKKLTTFAVALCLSIQSCVAYAGDINFLSSTETNCEDSISEVYEASASSVLTSEQGIKDKIQSIANDSTYGVGKYWGDQDCFLYARTVFEMIFGIKAPTVYYYNSQELTGSNADNVKLVASYADDGNHDAYSVLIQAKPGDIIQAKLWYGGISHTMIVWEVSATDNSITVLDCNSKGNNEICKRTISFANFVRGPKLYSGTTGQYEYSGYGNKFTINRSINYPSSAASSSSYVVNVGSANTLYSWETEAAINWALGHVGDSWIDDALNSSNQPYGFEAYHNCSQFVRSAYYGHTETAYISTASPTYWWYTSNWKYSTNTDEVPPRGALVFWEGNVSGEGNVGHVAISLGDGTAVMAGGTYVEVYSIKEYGKDHGLT